MMDDSSDLDEISLLGIISTDDLPALDNQASSVPLWRHKTEAITHLAVTSVIQKCKNEENVLPGQSR